MTTIHKQLKSNIIEAIKTVYDPEIPVNVYELGLIYEINIKEEGKIHILMTLTSPMCPVAESLPAEVKEKVEKLEEVKEVEIEMTFEPPWEPAMMSEEARLVCGFM